MDNKRGSIARLQKAKFQSSRTQADLITELHFLNKPQEAKQLNA